MTNFPTMATTSTRTGMTNKLHFLRPGKNIEMAWKVWNSILKKCGKVRTRMRKERLVSFRSVGKILRIWDRGILSWAKENYVQTLINFEFVRRY